MLCKIGPLLVYIILLSSEFFLATLPGISVFSLGICRIVIGWKFKVGFTQPWLFDRMSISTLFLRQPPGLNSQG